MNEHGREALYESRFDVQGSHAIDLSNCTYHTDLSKSGFRYPGCQIHRVYTFILNRILLIRNQYIDCQCTRFAQSNTIFPDSISVASAIMNGRIIRSGTETSNWDLAARNHTVIHSNRNTFRWKYIIHVVISPEHEDGGLTSLISVLSCGWMNKSLGVTYGFFMMFADIPFRHLLSFQEIRGNPNYRKSKWSLILFMVIMMVSTVLRIGIRSLHQGAMIIQFDYGTFGQWVV